jgi:hypothetical protein
MDPVLEATKKDTPLQAARLYADEIRHIEAFFNEHSQGQQPSRMVHIRSAWAKCLKLNDIAWGK